MDIYLTDECKINEIGLEIFLSREDVDFHPHTPPGNSFLCLIQLSHFQCVLRRYLLPTWQLMPQLVARAGFSAHTETAGSLQFSEWPTNLKAILRQLLYACFYAA